MDNIQTKQHELKMLYKDLESGQQKMLSGKLSASEATDLEKKAAQAEELQNQLDALTRVSRVLEQSRQIDGDPVMPAARDSKRNSASKSLDAQTPGELFTASDVYTDFIKAGMPSRQPSRKMPVALHGTKATITVTDGVVQPSRDRDIVRDPERTRLTIRDVVNVGTTDSGSVEFVVLDPGTHSAEPVAPEGVKPEADLGLDVAQAPTRTIAVHVPITEQSLQDVGFVRNIVDTELLYQLAIEEERQVLYGSGIGQNLAGILPLTGVPSITRTPTDPMTNLDRIMVGVTDVAVAGGDPNAVIIHPYDWEAIVLLKKTDDGYLWTLVTDSTTGRQRVWGLSVVVTPAAKNPLSTQRMMLVGDFRRGATLWDRQRATVEVGYIDDQFIKNMRTIRAEERLAFSVKRPSFFAKYETAAAA